MPSGRNNVLIVDITDLHRDSVSSVGEGGPAVSRTELVRKLRELTANSSSRPKAIGVDVDFSPDDYGNPITATDAEFMRTCREISEASRVPIYLGVYRHAADSEEKLLGSKDAAPLAAGISIGNARFQTVAANSHVTVREVLRMFTWTRVDLDETRIRSVDSLHREASGQREQVSTNLRSLASALAEPMQTGKQETNPWLRWALELRSEHSPDPRLKTQGFLVDYSSLDELISSTPEDVAGAIRTQKVEGRAIILGNVKNSEFNANGQDRFRIPGRVGDYPGALLHGCAVNTLVSDPLYELTLPGRVMIDMVLATLIILTLGALELRHDQTETEHELGQRLHWAVTLSVMLIALVIGVLGVAKTRIMWDDAPFVVLGLLLHSPFEHALKSIPLAASLRKWRIAKARNSAVHSDTEDP